ncbi:hypothetical protein BC332_31753 [Capsicum chinense]|nr:hypothetical protein BC332_31753 [Capsicum chinense]
MTLPCCMRKQPKPTLDASQYTTNPSEPSRKARTGADLKLIVTEFGKQLMIYESLKYNSKMVCMITITTGINQNIIYEDYNKLIQVLLEHTVYQVYKSCWGIDLRSILEKNGTLKLVKQFVDSGKWILVLDRNFIEMMVINTYSKRTVFLAHDSLSFAGAILYGRIDIG